MHCSIGGQRSLFRQSRSGPADTEPLLVPVQESSDVFGVSDDDEDRDQHPAGDMRPGVIEPEDQRRRRGRGHERGKRDDARQGERHAEPGECGQDRGGGETEKHPQARGDPFSADETEKDRKRVAHDRHDRGRGLHRGVEPPETGNRDGQQPFDQVAQQRQRAFGLADAPGDVRCADVAAALRLNVDAAPFGDEHPDRNGAAQVSGDAEQENGAEVESGSHEGLSGGNRLEGGGGVPPNRGIAMVGVTGFEPATSSTPRKRASRAAPHPDLIIRPYVATKW